MKAGAWLPVALSALPLCGCGPKTDPVAPPALPPMRLRPLQAELEALAGTAPAVASAERMAELADMIDGAFHPERTGRQLAARILHSLRAEPDAFLALEAALSAEEAGVRRLAALELAHLGEQASILPLLLRLKYETDPLAFCAAVQALHELGNDAGLAWMGWLIERPESAEEAGRLAIGICRRAGIDPGDAPTWEFLRQQMAALYRHWREHGVARREPPLEPPVAGPRTRARIAAHLSVLEGFQLRPVDEAKFVLSRAGVLAVPQLTTAAQAEEPYLRTVALELLASIGRPAATAAAAVLPLLADPLTAPYAARALGEIGASEALPHLLAMLDDPDIERRAAAASALGPLGDRRAVPALQRLFADAEQPLDVRVQAAYSLALFELERPAWRFLRRLRDEGRYHQATLDELLQRIEDRAR